MIIEQLETNSEHFMRRIISW